MDTRKHDRHERADRKGPNGSSNDDTTARPSNDVSEGGTSGRKLLGLYQLPDDLAEMTDEEIDAFAAAVVDEIRVKMDRPPKR